MRETKQTRRETRKEREREREKGDRRRHRKERQNRLKYNFRVPAPYIVLVVRHTLLKEMCSITHIGVLFLKCNLNWKINQPCYSLRTLE